MPGQPGKTLLSQDNKTTSGGERVAGPGTEHPEMSTHLASILTGTKLLCSALGGGGELSTECVCMHMCSSWTWARYRWEAA